MRFTSQKAVATAGALVLAAVVGWILSDRAPGIGWALLLLAAGLAIGLLIGWIIGRVREAAEDVGVQAPRIPTRVTSPRLAEEVGARLAGTPSDGSPADNGAAPPDKVVWVEGPDEVLVHLDETNVRVVDRTVYVSVPLETDQTGKTPLVVALAMGAPDDPAGLVCMTDDLPYGEPRLAARWGRTLQTAVWAGMLELASEHADERGVAPRGLVVSDGALHLATGEPLRVEPRARA